MTDITLCG